MSAPLEAAEQVAARARAGESFTSIARDLGISRVHAGRLAHRAGVAKRTGGPEHWQWKGGRRRRKDGYVDVLVEGRGYVLEHVLVAEQALGRQLPPKAVVHHLDENRGHNDGTNLVICQDQRYHLLLHQRMRALRESGHADWLKCETCGRWDDPASMYVRPRKNTGRHAACHAAAAALARARQ